MTWLLAVVLRPFGALLLFGFAALVAHVLVSPLIPNGRIKAVLFDRTIRKRHPWKFFLLTALAVWGTWAAMWCYFTYWAR